MFSEVRNVWGVRVSSFQRNERVQLTPNEGSVCFKYSDYFQSELLYSARLNRHYFPACEMLIKYITAVL